EVDFSQRTLEREIPRTLAEIEALEKPQVGGTGKFALAPFVQAAFHAKTQLPIKERTRAITIAEVSAFHARTFRPDRAALVVAGDFDPVAIRKTIDDLFANIKNPPVQPLPRPRVQPGTHAASWDVATRHLQVAWPLPPVSDADHPALTFASQALMRRLL